MTFITWLIARLRYERPCLATRLVVMLAARTHYLPTETARVLLIGPSSGDGEQQWNLVHGDWIRNRRFEFANGCPAGRDCFEILTIHPARHFWAFQAVETAIFIALAVSLLVATVTARGSVGPQPPQ